MSHPSLWEGAKRGRAKPAATLKKSGPALPWQAAAAAPAMTVLKSFCSPRGSTFLLCSDGEVNATLSVGGGRATPFFFYSEESAPPPPPPRPSSPPIPLGVALPSPPLPFVCFPRGLHYPHPPDPPPREALGGAPEDFWALVF